MSGRRAAAARATATITQATLVATGGGAELFEEARGAVAARLPSAERLTLERQGHVVDPKRLAPLLVRFFDDEGIERPS